MKFTPLPEDQFWIEYQKCFTQVDAPTDEDKERLRTRISCMQQALVDHLSARFEENEDFAIGWDWDYWHHVCGGIYSDAAICAPLLAAISSALSTDAEPHVWTFHAAVEAPTIQGGFYVRNGEVVYPANDPDFSQLLTRESPPH